MLMRRRRLAVPARPLLLLLLALLSASEANLPHRSVDVITIEARRGEVFRLQLDSSLLANASDVRPSDDMRFLPSVWGAPDLPDWLMYGYSAKYHSGVVYGVPPLHVHQFQLQIIATNRRTYETNRREVFVIVLENDDPPSQEVQLKINNVNPVDLFFDSRLGRLRDIFHQVLWPASNGDLRLSWLEVAGPPALSLVPDRHAGALLRLASSAPFSSQLRHLQREVRPLWSRVPCPRDFKRSSYERHFRRPGFQVDWCQFKLFERGELAVSPEQVSTVSPPTTSPLPALTPVLTLPARAAVPVRNYTRDLLVTVGTPLLVALLLCAALTCVMCCQGDHLETESDGEFFDNVFSVFVRRRPTDIQMVQYAGDSQPGTLRCQAGTLRSQPGTLRRSALRDVSPRLADQGEEPASERGLLRDVSPRLAAYHHDLSPTTSSQTTPDSSLHQPPPYAAASLSRRS